MRIVRKSNEVEARLLDAHRIAHLCVVGKSIADIRVALVAVYTTQKHLFAIYEEFFIPDFDGADADFATLAINHLSVYFDRGLQGVE